MFVLIRMFIGWMFVRAGYVKIFKDRPGKIIFFENIGLKPGVAYLYAIGLLEFVGGLFLMTGILTNFIAPILGLITIGASIVKLKYPSALKSDIEFYILWSLVCLWIGFK